MAIDMTPEQREVGEANFKKVTDNLGLNRRDFLKAERPWVYANPIYVGP